MNSTHFSLSSSAYKTNIFAGFSQLQKEEEFVDLTLAADGHMVHVHRSLIALASPYLRDILKSMAHTHNSSVIYLNNVSHEILTYLLNYIYLGEVNIPDQSVDAFIEVAKSLHIAGIEDLEPPKIKSPPKLLVAKKRKRPPGCSNITNHTKYNEVIKIQSSDNKDYLMDSQKQSDVINNANFIIQQGESYKHNQSNSNIVQNISLVHVNNENDIPDTKNKHYIYTDRLDQNQTSVETIQNMPIIQITNTNQLSQENTNFKIVVKTKEDHSTDVTSNMPVLEIQPIILTQDPEMIPQEHIPYNITALARDKSASEYVETNVSMTGTDMTQEHQTHDVSQDFPTETQSVNDGNKVIKVLDKIVIKPGVDISDANSSQIPLDQSIPSECKMDLMKHMAQFSITERGALHMILNRFIYCCHHTTRNKRRWRCIEYRRSACKAFVDTVNEAIVARSGLHAHPFHDKKIYQKHNRGLIFPTLELASKQRDLKEKEGLKMMSIEETDFDHDDNAIDTDLLTKS